MHGWFHWRHCKTLMGFELVRICITHMAMLSLWNKYMGEFSTMCNFTVLSCFFLTLTTCTLCLALSFKFFILTYFPTHIWQTDYTYFVNWRVLTVSNLSLMTVSQSICLWVINTMKNSTPKIIKKKTNPRDNRTDFYLCIKCLSSRCWQPFAMSSARLSRSGIRTRGSTKS